MSFKKAVSILTYLNALFILAVLSQSCTDNLVYDQFKSIDHNQWHKDSIVNFTYRSSDSLSKNNIYLNIRNNKTYDFSNFVLNVGIEFSNN